MVIEKDGWVRDDHTRHSNLLRRNVENVVVSIAESLTH